VGKLSERCADMARRCGDLSPLAAPVRQRLWESNRDLIRRGVSPDGRRVKDLAPSTLKRRKGTGPPRAPRGDSSRVVSDCVVSVDAGPGRLAFSKSWPNFPEIVYVDAARPTMGYAPEVLEWVRGQLRAHVIEGR